MTDDSNNAAPEPTKNRQPAATSPNQMPGVIPATVINSYTELAKAMSRTNMPSGITNWETALRIMLAGYEAGLPPMAALNDIHTTGPEGKLAMDTRAKVALVRNRGLGTIHLVEHDDKHATVRVHRHDWSPRETQLVTFTEQDAADAGLLDTGLDGKIKKKNWRNYKPDMIVARCYGRATNYHFQEILFHTPDELGLETDQWGDAIDLSPTHSKPPWQSSESDVGTPAPTTSTEAGAAAASEQAGEPPSEAASTASVASAIAPPVAGAEAPTPEQLQQLGTLARTLHLTQHRYRPWIKRVTGHDSAKEATSVAVAEAIDTLSLIKQAGDYCEGAGKDRDKSLATAAQRRGATDILDLTVSQLREIRDKARLAADNPLA